MPRLPGLSVNSARTPLSLIGALVIDPRDLRALDSDPRHESLLVEDKSVDVALDRSRREIPGDTDVDDDDARADAKLPAAARVQILDGRFGIRNIA